MDLLFYQQLMDILYEGVYFVDDRRTITSWNKGAEKLTGYSFTEVVGRTCHNTLLTHVDQQGEKLCSSGCPLTRVLEFGEPVEADLFLLHKEGHRIPVSVKASPIRGRNGKIVGAVEIFSDVTSHAAAKRRIDELEQLALLDPLTRIGNRRYLEMALEAKLAETSRFGTRTALFFLDLDDFKTINDTFGHQAGDEVLKVVGRTLSGVIRPMDVLGRWGGEEFIVAVSGVNKETALAIAQRFRALIEGCSVTGKDSGTVPFTVSIGATITRRNDSLASVIQRADRIMYQAKKAGKNKVRAG